ncbi:hypothetical protein LCGC14_1656370 [marine sediment metagenome]|uniref:Uncharacterized protein n=1 Tax=marine sediment metagenome TaxID=412755 RepID=A0A0F9HVC2_9ZZZZ
MNLSSKYNKFRACRQAWPERRDRPCPGAGPRKLKKFLALQQKLAIMICKRYFNNVNSYLNFGSTPKKLVNFSDHNVVFRPKRNLTLPHITLTLPHIKLHLPHITLTLPHIKLHLPHIKLHLPHIKLHLPHIKLHLPHITLTLPHIILTMPRCKRAIPRF